MAETLYLIDSYSLIFQVFHAIPEMSAPDGRPTNAVFGFSRDLLYLLESKKPDYLICAFDAAGPTFRDELLAEYKANRAPMPENLRPQFEMIRQVVAAMGIPCLECAGFEADDVIATIARRAREQQINTYICSGDKDVRQLIGPHVRVYNIRKDQVVDAATLQADWGVRPDQVIDLLSLTGDSVDNVPGIEGIGIKTGAALLQQFETLDGVLSNIDRVTGKKRQENLRRGAESSRRARELIRLRSDVPCEWDWQSARTGRIDARRLAELFGEFGFRRLTAQFSMQVPATSEWQASYRVLGSIEQLRDAVAALSGVRSFAVQVETSDVHPLQSRMVGIAVAAAAGDAWYVPIRTAVGDSPLPEDAVLREFASILESPAVLKHGHDLKRQMLALRHCGVHLHGVGVDTMVADYLLEAGERSHELAQIAQRYLRHALGSRGASAESGPGRAALDQLPVRDAAQWACERADVAVRAGELLQAQLAEQGLWQLYESVEAPLIDVLADMEFAGVFVDVPLLARLGREFSRRLGEIQQQIYELAGGEFNIASPVQLRQVLFERLGLRVVKRTKTGPSTDQEVLEALAREHALPALLIEHRQIAKLKGTYVDALPKLVNPDTGCVHATLNQVVAATGRLSSSDPNLQNIPIRTEQGRQIRQAFVPRRGRIASTAQLDLGFGARGDTVQWYMLSADYSQIELRLLAHYSDDPELAQAFAQDQDIHAFVASQIYAVPPADVSAEQRRTAKTVNFGVVYGLSPFGLAARLGISQEEAESFIAAYFAKYHGVDSFIRGVLARASRDGCVTTILGRRRRVAGVRPNPGRWLNQSEREAVNTVLQGSAADLIKQAMVRLQQRIRTEGFQSMMVLQIHDELLFEVRSDELARFAPLVGAEMTSAIPLKVPLKVDMAVGPNWLDVEPIV